MASNVPKTITAATVVVTRPLYIVLKLLAGVLPLALPVRVLHVSLVVSFHASYTSVVSSVTISPTISLPVSSVTSLPATSGSVPVFEAPILIVDLYLTCNCPPASSGTRACGCQHFFLKAHEKGIAELENNVFACKDCILKLASFLSAAASKEVTLVSQVTFLQTNLTMVHASLIAARPSASLATAMLTTLCTGNGRSKCQWLFWQLQQTTYVFKFWLRKAPALLSLSNLFVMNAIKI